MGKIGSCFVNDSIKNSPLRLVTRNGLRKSHREDRASNRDTGGSSRLLYRLPISSGSGSRRESPSTTAEAIVEQYQPVLRSVIAILAKSDKITSVIYKETRFPQ